MDATELDVLRLCSASTGRWKGLSGEGFEHIAKSLTGRCVQLGDRFRGALTGDEPSADPAFWAEIKLIGWRWRKNSLLLKVQIAHFILPQVMPPTNL